MSRIEQASQKSLQKDASKGNSPELRGRLQHGLKELFPGATPTQIPALFSEYLGTLASKPNRETRRRLTQWLEQRRGNSSIDPKENEEIIQYIEALGKYESQHQAYREQEKEYALAESAYQDDQKRYEEQFKHWQTLRETYQQAGETQKTSRKTTTTEMIEVDVPHRLSNEERKQGDSIARPGFVDTAKTEKAWKAMYAEALQKLAQESRTVKPKGAKPEKSWLTFLGRGKAAIQAFMLLVTTVMIAAPRGEQTYEAGSDRSHVAAAPRPETDSRLEQAKAQSTHEKLLEQATLEQSGPHELLVRVGNGEGTQQRFVIGSQVTRGNVGFEVGSHYRTVAFRPGEQTQQVTQINSLADQALNSYHLPGVHADAARTVIDHIDVTLTGSASLEGQKAGNIELVNRRMEATRALVRQSFAARGIDVNSITFHQENRGMQGNEQQAASALQTMGVHLQPRETWHGFMSQLASTERTEGVAGVRHLMASHGAHSFDEARFNTFFEQNFRAHRAVGVEIQVSHRAVTVLENAPGKRVDQPIPAKSVELPVTTTVYVDVDNPYVASVDPPGQTSGQLYKSRKRLFLQKTEVEEQEEGVPGTPGTAPLRPEAPVRPIPPVPPILPTLDLERPVAEPNKAGQGPDTRRRPTKKSGWTHRSNV